MIKCEGMLELILRQGSCRKIKVRPVMNQPVHWRSCRSSLFFFNKYEKSMHKSTFYKDYITVKYEVKDKSSSIYVLALDTGFNVLY